MRGGARRRAGAVFEVPEGTKSKWFVSVEEAEQIVAKARANGTPVWYLRAENEGHGFARKENADFQFYATILFMRETILK